MYLIPVILHLMVAFIKPAQPGYGINSFSGQRVTNHPIARLEHPIAMWGGGE